MDPVFVKIAVNVAYALVGGFGAIFMMKFGYRMLDSLTPFDTSEQLKQGNEAVGRMVQGAFTGIGIVMGLVVGLSLM